MTVIYKKSRPTRCTKNSRSEISVPRRLARTYFFARQRDAAESISGLRFFLARLYASFFNCTRRSGHDSIKLTICRKLVINMKSKVVELVKNDGLSLVSQTYGGKYISTVFSCTSSASIFPITNSGKRSRICSRLVLRV